MLSKRLCVLSMACWLFWPVGLHSQSRSSTIVVYPVKNEADSIEENVPATFGAVFAKGDIPEGFTPAASDASGHSIPLKVDVKARNADGSLRHAVLTAIFPHLAKGATDEVALHLESKQENAPTERCELPANLDASVVLSSNGQTLTTSLRKLVDHQRPDMWLSGALVCEAWFVGPLNDSTGKPDPHLTARFGLRSYGANRPVRIEIDIENTTTWVPSPHTAFYDAEIDVGGRSVWSKAGMSQPAHTRWRKVFWWNGVADVYVTQDLAYLKKARVIPNYDVGAKLSESELSARYRKFEESPRDPLETGIVTRPMPMTGGRPDLGILPEWAVDYLLSMDKDAYEMTIVSGDLSGSYASHYRNEKTGRPAKSEEFPNISTHSNYVGRPGNLPLPDSGGYKTNVIPQSAHEPSLAFVPYLVTGERYYLEELEFWSQWNSWGTAPKNHGFGSNLVTWDEIRGIGWSLRTLAQAAYIVPDSDPMKSVLQRELKANFDELDRTYTNNASASVLHIMMRNPPPEVIPNPAPVHLYEYSPWMDDYLTASVGYAVGLGFEYARPFARWKAEFPVQRMINPQWCWIVATPYRVIAQNPDGSLATSWADAYKYTFLHAVKNGSDPGTTACDTPEMAEALGLHQQGEMLGNARSSGGYPANMQGALAAAVDLGVAGAPEAWAKFANRPVQPPHIDPQWAILPWNAH